jgi:DNA polymerase-1
MIMQVHDELVFEIKETDIPTIGSEIINLMTNAEALKVPLIVNTFHGNSWRDV